MQFVHLIYDHPPFVKWTCIQKYGVYATCVLLLILRKGRKLLNKLLNSRGSSSLASSLACA